MTDTISLILRITILYFLAVASQVAFQKRMWIFVILLLGMYLNIFRLALLRGMTIYIGIFSRANPELVDRLRINLMGSSYGIIADIPFLIGTIMVFLYVVGYENGGVKVEKKRSK